MSVPLLSPDRHHDIHRQVDHYASFPDLVRLSDGRLLCVFRLSAAHVADQGYSRLVLSESQDLGRSWSPPRALSGAGHCPRMALLPDHSLMILDDLTNQVFHSFDAGKSFTVSANEGDGRFSLPDRPIPLHKGYLGTVSHTHRGKAAQSRCGQAPIEQLFLRSENGGRGWQARSVMHYDRSLSLCEASVTRLADRRLLALCRENSGVGEPMYALFSSDEGESWSDPLPTHLPGHRPTLGHTRDGRLLVSYRDIGPNPGTSVFLGSLDEMTAGFAPQARWPGGRAPACDVDGLRLRLSGDSASDWRLILRPLTDPSTATAKLSLTACVTEGEHAAMSLRFGGKSFRLYRQRLSLLDQETGEDELSWPLAQAGLAHIELLYRHGTIVLRVNGQGLAELATAPASVATRTILLGSPSDKKVGGPGSLHLAAIEQLTAEPRYGRSYRFSWSPAHGLPDAASATGVLRLAAADPKAHGADFGYSGWAETDDGQFVCVYHHVEPDTLPSYEWGVGSFVRASRFCLADFRP